MSGAKTVLYADDNALVQKYVRCVLEAEGMTVIVTGDGEEAVTLARERRPDAIILDLLMPQVDGLSALVRLKGDDATRHIPVLLASGVPGSEGERLAAAYGAAGFLNKPFRPADLLESLYRMLEPLSTGQEA